MDTKSKKFSQNIILRTSVFALVIVLMVQVLIGCMMMVSADSDYMYFRVDDIFEEKSYMDSSDLQSKMHSQMQDVLGLFRYYRSEENILAGRSVTNEELNNYIEEMYAIGWVCVGSRDIQANYDYEGYEPYAEFEGDVRNKFVEANSAQIEQIKEDAIENDFVYFKRSIKHLSEIEGFTYYVTDGSSVMTNVPGENVKPADFKKNPVYTIYENGEIERQPANRYYDNYYGTYLSDDVDDYGLIYNDSFTACVAYDDAYISKMNEEYTRMHDTVKEWLPMVMSSLICAALALLWLMVTTGGRRPDGTRKLYAIDKLWTEVQLVIFGSALSAAAGCGVEAVNYAHSYAYFRNGGASAQLTAYAGEYSTEGMIGSLGSITMIAVFTACIVAAGWYFLSLIRLLKARVFIKNSLTYKICAKIGKPVINAVGNIMNGGSIMRKIAVLAVLICLLSATVFLAPVVLVVLLVFAPKWVNRFEEIQRGVDEVKSGNLTYKIPLDPEKPDDELSRLAKGINEISEASNVAVQNELKNQRMKTELISNVSHDLKTPLTSMVSYIDLLKKEGLDSPNAPEYLDILDQKTERLRKLTEDLFEAAKASSGAMPVNLETVDLLSLVNQSMGEMSSRIEASSLDFILNAEKDRYYVRADGQLLYRVVENLLVNVLKYAQDGSRVYIDIKEPLAGIGAYGNGAAEDGTQSGGSGTDSSSGRTESVSRRDIVVLEIKNMSKQQLNINADELMERFKRGDDSRTTEGSGLGLAIAKDLVKLMDGWFEIAIDGDLFKARVVLSKAAAPAYAESGTANQPEGIQEE